jgi:prepilin-type N-terminal cleavage/methylation domain-containing protein/prepilin-type processing-associated H-X9-DG protein
MRRTAFTLVELLIVISVIAMLFGVLVPVLRAAREQARAVTCGSNLKQLCTALMVYEQENETFPYGFDDSAFGTIIPPGGYPGDATCDLQGWWWFHSLSDSFGEDFGEKSVFWCPSRTLSSPHILCGNYGVNRAICKDALGFGDMEFVGRPLGTNQIRRVAETLLITDSGYSLISWRGVTNASVPRFDNRRREGSFYVPGLKINEDRVILPGHEQDALDGRHLNKSVNVGFADGHLSCLRADDLLVQEVGGDYINGYPLWLLE